MEIKKDNTLELRLVKTLIDNNSSAFNIEKAVIEYISITPDYKTVILEGGYTLIGLLYTHPVFLKELIESLYPNGEGINIKSSDGSTVFHDLCYFDNVSDFAGRLKHLVSVTGFTNLNAVDDEKNTAFKYLDNFTSTNIFDIIKGVTQ